MASDTMHSPTSPTSPTRIEPVPQVFALVIGINEYASEDYPKLSAATRDADTFEEFLRDNLHVPQSNITSLRDAQATRDAIMSSFIALRDNINIKKDEAAIVIYFAGHGARVDKPVEWEDWKTTGGQIEMMCPYDMGVVVRNKDGVQESTPGIPDRTVSVLLNHLSDVKGDNITLILDCCSSAGITRSGAHEHEPEQNLGLVARRIANPPAMSSECDRRLWSRGTRTAGIAQGFSGKFHASHVLLAACGRDQSAWEDPKTGQGMFTQGILKVLKEQEVDDLTYTSLMHRLNMPLWQTPHCEGQNVARRLFNNKALGADASFIAGLRQRDSTIILQAGASQGITVGSKFGVHSTNLITDPNRPNVQLGVVVATSVDAFSSRLSMPAESPRFRLPKLTYCRLIERGSENIALYCEDKAWLETIFPPDQHEAYSVIIVDSPEDAALQITIADGQVYFDRRDKLVQPHIGARLPHAIDMKNLYTIREVVRCTIHFYHHLTRTGDDDFRNVWMELKKLKVEHNDVFDQISIPVGDNLIDEEPAIVVVDEMDRLGLTIFNQTDLPLYPFLFYFDPSDLMIIEWYTPPFGAGAGKITATVDVPLPPKSELTIGYGDGGVAPWQFLLREGEHKDVGFFKLFLTTSPTSFSNIIQDSPFETSISRHGGPAAPKQPDAQRWATKLSTVIQVDQL